ncbi:MAG: hypothetical protein CSA34_00170 [Desulfobulbus propionicus]|nr:MAG: hypothetical protein CSA34_00170 [Desulfobulbus propionicus]
MHEFQEKAVVLETKELSRNVVRLRVRSTGIASEARPGQFVMVRIGSSSTPLLRRPFSIHKVKKNSLSLLYKVVGQGTEQLRRTAPGEELDLLGPLGRGFPLPGKGEKICLVGGGMGIAPLTFLAQRIAAMKRDFSSDRVLLGAATASELQPLVRDFSALGFQVKEATDDGSLGYKGVVTALLPPLLSDCQRIYVCGPHTMMAAAAGLCHTAGVTCLVSLETHMACGLGACLGCTIFASDGSYRHVCKNGPVFNAKEVAWML